MWRLFDTHFVLEAGEGDPENLQEILQSVVRQFYPPLFQNGLLGILQNPEEADQQMAGGVLFHYHRSFLKSQKQIFTIIWVYKG